MKPIVLAACLLIGNLAFQSEWTNGKGLSLKAKSWQANQDKSLSRTFLARGGATLTSTPDGLVINSDSLDFKASPNPSNKKVYVVRQATAIKSVIIVKTVDSSDGKQTTDIRGTKAVYVAGDLESTVTMSGPVTIKNLDQAQAQTMVATGSSGVAVLDAKSKVKKGNGLKKAALEGPVKVIFNQQATDSAEASVITATASHAVLENIGSSRKVTLTGAVHIVGQSIGETSGVSRAVFVLGKNREWKLEAAGTP